jgi:hypothetical protein
METKAFVPDIPWLEELRLPIVYEGDNPTAVVVEIGLFRALMRRLEELEDEELLNDPEIVAALQAGQADYLAGRTTPIEEVIREMGLEGEI